VFYKLYNLRDKMINDFFFFIRKKKNSIDYMKFNRMWYLMMMR